MPAAADAARDVLALAASRPPSLGAGRLVCVDGPAGSGKTTLAAALLAFAQTDFKRLLAYSTLSQIAIMLGALAAAPVEERPGQGEAPRVALGRRRLHLRAAGLAEAEELGGLHQR